MTASSSEQSFLIFPDGKAPLTTQIRSTLIMSSQKTLRDAGVFAEYEAVLEPAHRDALLETSTPRWMDIDLGLAHYRACDALGLGPNRVVDMAQGVGSQRRGTFLGVAVNLAAGIGVTPWTVAAQADRIWRRGFIGGAMGSVKTGEKEARIEVAGWPCATYAYCRYAMRGLILGVMGLLSPHASVHELTGLSHRETAIAYRLTWR